VTAGALSHGTTAARECRRTACASHPANPIKLAKMARKSGDKRLLR
jgi:hypothetical protein